MLNYFSTWHIICFKHCKIKQSPKCQSVHHIGVPVTLHQKNSGPTLLDGAMNTGRCASIVVPLKWTVQQYKLVVWYGICYVVFIILSALYLCMCTGPHILPWNEYEYILEKRYKMLISVFIDLKWLLPNIKPFVASLSIVNGPPVRPSICHYMHLNGQHDVLVVERDPQTIINVYTVFFLCYASVCLSLEMSVVGAITHNYKDRWNQIFPPNSTMSNATARPCLYFWRLCPI